MKSFKVIAVILITFLLAFATSFALDYLQFTENPIKYMLVILLIFIEIYFGFLIYKSKTAIKNK
jgi:hypothetical protein